MTLPPTAPRSAENEAPIGARQHRNEAPIGAQKRREPAPQGHHQHPAEARTYSGPTPHCLQVVTRSQNTRIPHPGQHQGREQRPVKTRNRPPGLPWRQGITPQNSPGMSDPEARTPSSFFSQNQGAAGAFMQRKSGAKSATYVRVQIVSVS